MRVRGKLLASIVLAFAVLTLLSTVAFAVPQTINYQGYIEDSGGVPVNGTLSMTFSIYNSSTGGSALWTETQDSVTVAHGAFSVALGSVTPITLPFDEQYYLGVKVEADGEMTPRAVLVSVPYAMRAGSADSAVTLGDKTLSQIVSLLDGRYNVGDVLVANFSADDNSIYTNQTVNFADLSLGAPTLWNWDFGDSGTSSLQNPTYTYTTPGIYTVSLTVQDGLTSNTKSVTDYITVNEIAPDFSAAPRSIYTNQSVNFTDLTQGVPISWSWDFGDTGTDTVQNPQHMYTAPGSYTVALTVDDGASVNTATKTDYITVSEVAPDFTVDETAISVNETVYFTDWTQGVPISWNWDFGDTGTSTLQNPSHQYTTDGTFTVSLTADDGVNSNTETKVDYITVYTFPRSSIATVVSTDDVGRYSSIAIGGDGLPVIAYYNATSASLEVAHCGDVSCSAGNTVSTVDDYPAGNVGIYPSIVNGTDGLPVIAYLDAYYGDLKVVRCGDASCSKGNSITTVDSAGIVGHYPSIAIGTDDLPVISHYDYSNGDLRVVHCGNASCSSGNSIVTVDSTDDVGRFTSIAIGADGKPVISYQDYTNQDLKVAYCGDALCSSSIITTVDWSGNIGAYTSIAIGTDDKPIVSYYDSLNGGLKAVHCGDASCSTGNTITMVDPTGNVGYDTSIAIGTDDLPIISYFGLSYGNLKVVHCGDASCSSGNTISMVYTTEYDGKYTSIAVGSDDLPVISYYDETNGNLKAAHCTDAVCTLWPK